MKSHSECIYHHMAVKGKALISRLLFSAKEKAVICKEVDSETTLLWLRISNLMLSWLFRLEKSQPCYFGYSEVNCLAAWRVPSWGYWTVKALRSHAGLYHTSRPDHQLGSGCINARLINPEMCLDKSIICTCWPKSCQSSAVTLGRVKFVDNLFHLNQKMMVPLQSWHTCTGLVNIS